MSRKLSFAELKAKRKAARRAARMALFGDLSSSPTRDSALQRFLSLMAAWEANDAAALFAFLRDQRRGYDERHDGASPVMALVDEIEKLRSS